MTAQPGGGGFRLSDRLPIPFHGAGARIGLLGGSFNPPHAGHRAISLFAMKRLRLDQIWWLVTPGNPLKRNDAPPPIDRRLAEARACANHPRIVVTDLEAAIGMRFTDDTIAFLRRRCPGARFVWLMGADNLAEFHRWRNWRRLATRLPIAVIDRPPMTFRALASPAARRLELCRLDECRAARLAEASPPAWVFLHGIKSPLSSTELRKSRRGLAD
jgi:nicotinate-nucleotide adenylyltransferase